MLTLRSTKRTAQWVMLFTTPYLVHAENGDTLEGDTLGNTYRHKTIQQQRPIPATRITLVQQQSKRTKRAAFQAGALTWPNNKVYYSFEQVSNDTRHAFLDAAAHIESRTQIQFIKRPSQRLLGNYINIRRLPNVRDIVGNSAIGMAPPLLEQDTPQELGLIEWASRHTILHELMHVLGFGHEHQRADRDKYVNVVQTGDDYDIDRRLSTGAPFDYHSVTLYGNIISKDPKQLINNQNELSVDDVIALNSHYFIPTDTPRLSRNHVLLAPMQNETVMLYLTEPRDLVPKQIVQPVPGVYMNITQQTRWVYRIGLVATHEFSQAAVIKIPPNLLRQNETLAFELIPNRSHTAPPPADSSIWLIADGKCLQALKGAGLAGEDQVALRSCSEKTAQHWQFDANSSLMNQDHPGQCLTKGGPLDLVKKPSAYYTVNLQACDSTPEQRWTYTDRLFNGIVQKTLSNHADQDLLLTTNGITNQVVAQSNDDMPDTTQWHWQRINPKQR